MRDKRFRSLEAMKETMNTAKQLDNIIEYFLRLARQHRSCHNREEIHEGIEMLRDLQASMFVDDEIEIRDATNR